MAGINKCVGQLRKALQRRLVAILGKTGLGLEICPKGIQRIRGRGGTVLLRDCIFRLADRQRQVSQRRGRCVQRVDDRRHVRHDRRQRVLKLRSDYTNLACIVLNQSKIIAQLRFLSGRKPGEEIRRFDGVQTLRRGEINIQRLGVRQALSLRFKKAFQAGERRVSCLEEAIRRRLVELFLKRFEGVLIGLRDLVCGLARFCCLIRQSLERSRQRLNVVGDGRGLLGVGEQARDKVVRLLLVQGQNLI